MLNPPQLVGRFAYLKLETLIGMIILTSLQLIIILMHANASISYL